MSDQTLAKCLAVAVAGIVQFTMTWGRYNAWSTISGLILASILLSIPASSEMNRAERLMLSFVWGLTALLTLGRLLESLLQNWQGLPLTPPQLMFVAWAVVAAVVYSFLAARAKGHKN